MIFAYDSNIGKVREVNQDRACVLKNDANEYLGIVCDGMGGHQAGELASSLAIETICQSFLEVSPLRTTQDGLKWINEAICKANEAIYDDALKNEEHRGMGTTVACCLILKDAIVIAHVGDSRVYQVNPNQLLQLTKDHTYVNLLVDSGTITKEQAKTHPKKNILMKALGVFETVVVSTMVIENKQQVMMICSDGLYNVLSDEEVLSIISKHDSIHEQVFDMITQANLNGGTDNISVVLMNGGVA